MASGYALDVAGMYLTMLRRDREREGLRISQAAWRLGITPAALKRIEAGEPITKYETWDRICKLYGWPQTFPGRR